EGGFMTQSSSGGTPPPIPPYQPQYYHNAPTKPLRPASVTVLAIIGIILGALGSICTPFSILPYMIDFGVDDPAFRVMRSNSALSTYIIASTVLHCLVAITLLISGIGSLTLKPWARLGMLLYAWVSLILNVLGTILTIAWIAPAMADG